MKKILKLLILFSSIIFIYLIYNFTNNKNITYLALGDGLTLGENSYGGISYSYSDYFKDYLKQENMLKLYSKDYASKNKSIINLHNDILKNKEIKIDNITYNFKELLRESDIISLSIG